jgi:hypothetical protein
VQELLKVTPDIIKAAAQSELGLFALMVIVAAVVAILLFRKAGTPLKMAIYLFLVGGFIAFGAAYVLKSKEAEIKPSDAQLSKASPTDTPSLIADARPSASGAQATPYVSASAHLMPSTVPKQSASPSNSQQTPLPEESAAKQQSRFASQFDA